MIVSIPNEIKTTAISIKQNHWPLYLLISFPISYSLFIEIILSKKRLIKHFLSKTGPARPKELIPAVFGIKQLAFSIVITIPVFIAINSISAHCKEYSNNYLLFTFLLLICAMLKSIITLLNLNRKIERSIEFATKNSSKFVNKNQDKFVRVIEFFALNAIDFINMFGRMAVLRGWHIRSRWEVTKCKYYLCDQSGHIIREIVPIESTRTYPLDSWDDQKASQNGLF
jgi:hypothetical protein